LLVGAVVVEVVLMLQAVAVEVLEVIVHLLDNL
jgi:hypothetical protein